MHYILYAQDAMLNDLWRDILTIGGLIATLAGFAITIYQVLKAKSAAVAAKKAVETTRVNFQRYAVANLQRFFREALIHVDNKDWIMASVRLSDSADQSAQMMHVAPLGNDEGWREATEQLRLWADTMQRIAVEKTSLQPNKWREFQLRLSSRIDASHGPFVSQEDEVMDD